MPKPRSPAAPTRGGAHATRERITAPRELVVMMDADVDLHAAPTGLASARGADLASLARVLDAGKAALDPLFGLTEERLRHRAAATARGRSHALPDLGAYYRVDAPAASLDSLADQLRTQPSVRAAYVKPAAELPMHIGADALPLATEAPPSTPDFSGRQVYLDAAPGGIDARYAWTRAGGRGSDVRIIDIEGAWRFTHEDLTQNQGGVSPAARPTTRLLAQPRHRGRRRVQRRRQHRRHHRHLPGRERARGLDLRAASARPPRSATPPTGCAPATSCCSRCTGPGRAFNFQDRDRPGGYIAVEWWPDDFAAIRYAIAAA